MADPPGQPALARTAGRQDDGEFGGDIEILGDNLYPALRYVRDGAITRQQTGTELDLCEPSAQATLALTPIH